MRIEVRDVRKAYGGVEALAGVSLNIASGAKVALIGPNGSGKSTLVRVVMGLLGYRGEVRLDGHSPFEHRVSLARRMAYVPQGSPQLRASVREVVRAVCQLRRVEPSAVTELADELELDLEDVADRPVRGLSGGMRQKLFNALALAARADLLILDEPTASLDARNRARFFRQVREQAASATVLLSSHRLEEIEHLVDQVVALKAGLVAFDGPVATFLGTRSLSLIEVQTTDGIHADWLFQNGFSRGARGIWVKTVSRLEKMGLLGQISSRFDGALDNVVARDLEAIDEA
ncbi:MAG: ABC transporter ATP-binding protein [Isosphaeraceae bacterium]